MPEQQPSKIVKVRDLDIQLSAFADINNLNFIDRMILKSEEQSIGSQAIAAKGKGLYVDSAHPSLGSLYVDSKFVDEAIDKIRKDPHLTDGMRKELDKLSGTVGQAVQACPDQTAQLQAGKIRPLAGPK